MLGDFTFIIHGNYDETHIPMCAELKRFGKVILSTNKKYMDHVSQHANHYDKIICESDIDVTNIYNHQNIYLHINSVLNGLRQCDTQYVVIVRTNHCYSNIQYLVNKVRSNINDKYLCSNIAVNPEFPYHPCDNIIAGTKELVFSIYKTAYSSILAEDFIYQDNDIRMCAEVLLFISYLKYKNIKINKINGNSYFYVDGIRNGMVIHGYISDQYRSIMKENLELIDVENLAPYVINFNSHTFDVIFRNIKNVDELLSKTNLNF
jgi:hypothetical protein